MKKLIIILCVAAIAIGAAACKEETEKITFSGTIIEINGNSGIVEAFEGEEIRNSADKITVDLSVSEETFEVGDNIEVEYDGEIMESYPAQVNAIAIEKID